MANAAVKLDPEKTDQPVPDFSKPVPLKWWKLPSNEPLGTRADGLLKVAPSPTRIDDGIECTGLVETITLQTNGTVLVGVRVGTVDGLIRYLVFRGGHGAVL